MDYTAFFLNPKGDKVLADKREKSVYQQLNSDEKRMLYRPCRWKLCRHVLPIFKYERRPRKLSISVKESWSIGRSESGLMTMETFSEYICNIFIHVFICTG